MIEREVSMWKRLLKWLGEHNPVWCVVCGRLVFEKDARYRQSTLGMRLAICQACEQELFHPFSGGKR